MKKCSGLIAFSVLPLVLGAWVIAQITKPASVDPISDYFPKGSFTSIIHYETGLINWDWSIRYPLVRPWLELQNISMGERTAPTKKAPTLKLIDRIRLWALAGSIKHTGSIEILGTLKDAPSLGTLRGSCNIDTQSCTGKVLGGEIKLGSTAINGWQVQLTRLKASELAEIYPAARHLEGEVSGLISVAKNAAEIRLDGVMVSRNLATIVLPSSLQMIAPIQVVFSKLLSTPFQVDIHISTAQIKSIRSARAQNRSGKLETTQSVLLAHDSPLLFPLRWFPNKELLGKELTTALGEPGGPPSLGMALRLDGTRVSLAADIGELEHKGKRWLKQELNDRLKNIDLNKLQDALSKSLSNVRLN